MNDVTPINNTDETPEGSTEVKLTITPKQKLIAKIVGATTVVAGVFVLGMKLGSDDEPTDEELADLLVELDETDDND